MARELPRAAASGQERTGLSVTAKNSATHWRRVWLFLHVTSEAPEVKVDSTARKSGS